MGLISLILTLIIIVSGSLYFISGNNLSFTAENSEMTKEEEPSAFQELKTEAIDLKDTLEEKVAETSEALKEKTETSLPKDEERTSEDTQIVNRLMSSGFSVPKNPRSIDTIVLHSSYNSLSGDPYSISAIVKIYESYEVSAHYIIDRSGKIYRLVEDKNIAYHAGASKMPDGRQDVNNFSIGIEMVNKEKGDEYTKAQYEAVNDLIGYLKGKYPIKNVIGHSDIAPGRKTDPWNFDWKKLK